VPCAKGDNGTPLQMAGRLPDTQRIRVVTVRREAVGEESLATNMEERHTGVPHASRQNLGWKLCVKDKWVKLDSRTLDPEWRDSAVRAKKGNNGSRRPYIKPQGAGSE